MAKRKINSIVYLTVSYFERVKKSDSEFEEQCHCVLPLFTMTLVVVIFKLVNQIFLLSYMHICI